MITASWYHLFMEEQNSEKLTSGNYNTSGIMTVSNGTLKTSDITVTASSKTTGKSQEVTIHILTVPCLEGLSIVMDLVKRLLLMEKNTICFPDMAKINGTV